MKITIPISVGELLDKISILQIKSQYINNSYVIVELEDLTKIAKECDVYDEEEIQRLLEVNSKLWKIEDELRISEHKFIFDDEFIRNTDFFLKKPLIYTCVTLFILGIILHRLFCVRTTIDKLLFPNAE